MSSSSQRGRQGRPLPVVDFVELLGPDFRQRFTPARQPQQQEVEKSNVARMPESNDCDQERTSVSIVKKEAATHTMVASSPTKLENETKPKVAEKARATIEKAPAAARKRNGLKKGPSKGNPIKVYNGVPVCDLEGGWPGGWRMETFQRWTGAKDYYWYSPIKNKKLRSMLEVKSFIITLKESGGDEEEAWKKIHK